MFKKLVAVLVVAFAMFGFNMPMAFAAASGYGCSGWHYADSADHAVSIQNCVKWRRTTAGVLQEQAVKNFKVNYGTTSRGIHVGTTNIDAKWRYCNLQTVTRYTTSPATYTVPRYQVLQVVSTWVNQRPAYNCGVAQSTPGSVQISTSTSRSKKSWVFTSSPWALFS